MSLILRRFRFSNGERAALLIDSQTGIPVHYQNLYVTIHHRNPSDSINTEISCLNNLKYLAEILEYENINLEYRFLTNNLLTKQEIESISRWAKKTSGSLSEIKAKSITEKTKVCSINSHRLEFSRCIVVIDTDRVESNTIYKRLTDFTKYICWLANILCPTKTEIPSMERQFLAHRPTKHKTPDDSSNFKSLTKDQIIRLLDVVRPDSTENPWSNESVRHRNQLIINLLYHLGCRKGELLLTKLTQIDSAEKLIAIRRNADDESDPRMNEPLVKTLSRDIEITETILNMIDDYVIFYRSKIKNAGKTPYLFLSHQKKTPVASPLSISAIDKIFTQLTNLLGFNVHPHKLRHTWNDDFRTEMDPIIESGAMSKTEVEDLQSYLMGWKEGSGTAARYTRRYHHKKAIKLGLHLQNKRLDENEKIVGNYDEQLDF